MSYWDIQETFPIYEMTFEKYVELNRSELEYFWSLDDSGYTFEEYAGWNWAELDEPFGRLESECNAFNDYLRWHSVYCNYDYDHSYGEPRYYELSAEQEYDVQTVIDSAWDYVEQNENEPLYGDFYTDTDIKEVFDLYAERKDEEAYEYLCSIVAAAYKEEVDKINNFLAAKVVEYHLTEE